MRYIALALAAAVLSGCAALSAETPAPGKTTTARAARGDLVLGLSADGSITLPVTGLDFAVSGIIKNIYAAPGDRVKQGDLLAELDDTDLRLALKTAQNNLEKAQLAYEEATANAAYALRSETLNRDAAREKLDAAFDTYAYQLSIDNAALSLERGEQDWADTALAAAQAETAARLALTRREAELTEARDALEKLEAEETAAFDGFNHQNSIETAQTQLERLAKPLSDAKDALKKAKKDLQEKSQAYEKALMEYENTLRLMNDTVRYLMGEELSAELAGVNTDFTPPSDAAVVAARETVTQKENAVNTAQYNYDDAARALGLARENLTRDENAYHEDEAERADDARDAARKALEKARQAADDAQTALENTLTDNAQRMAAARQKTDDAAQSLARAQEELARAQAQHRDERRDAQSAYDLQSLKLDNLTNADLSIKNALFNIEDAKNNLAVAENNLAKVRVTAPIDGEVLDVTKRVGEKVAETESASSFFMGSSSTSNSFITLRDTTEIYLSANIPEGDIVGLSEGQAIRAEVDALGEEVLYATVYSISSIPRQDSSGIVTYEVVGVLDAFNEHMRDRMSVFLTFIKREIKDALLIPNRAVFMEDGQQYVYVENENAREKRAVSCGFSNGTQTEVTSGLEAGETVIVGRVTMP